MEGYWPVLFMLIALKIPAIAMIWLLYWAATNEQENGITDEGEDGGRKRKPRPFMPRGPRRDPHGGGLARPAPRRGQLGVAATGRRIRGGSSQAEPARAREQEPDRPSSTRS